MSASPTAAPSRTLPITLLGVGAAMLAGAAFLWFLGPGLFVIPYYESMPEMEESDTYYDTIQSGHAAALPGNFEMTVVPQWVWQDPEFNEAMMQGGEVLFPEFACSVSGPDGRAIDAPFDAEMVGVSFLTLEAGDYVIECDKGGMLEVNGQNAELNAGLKTAARNEQILAWSSVLMLLGSLSLLPIGAYILGARNVEKRAADRATLRMLQEEAPVFPASSAFVEPRDGVSSLERSSAASPDPAPEVFVGGSAGSATGREMDGPNGADVSQSYVVRPRATRAQARDPFTED